MVFISIIKSHTDHFAQSVAELLLYVTKNEVDPWLITSICVCLLHVRLYPLIMGLSITLYTGTSSCWNSNRNLNVEASKEILNNCVQTVATIWVNPNVMVSCFDSLQQQRQNYASPPHPMPFLFCSKTFVAVVWGVIYTEGCHHSTGSTQYKI